MNKSIKLLFVFSIILLFSISLISINAKDVEAWSLFGWFKPIFGKKTVITTTQIKGGVSSNGAYNPSNPRNIYDEQFPTPYLKSLKDKCYIYDKILNYCKNANLNKWNDKTSVMYRYNEDTTLTYGNSMSPLIPVNTKLAVRKLDNGIDTSKLYSCEIVRVESVYDKGKFIIHRIIGKDRNGNFVTRGDNNKKDNYEIIERKDIIERVCGKLE